MRMGHHETVPCYHCRCNLPGAGDGIRPGTCRRCCTRRIVWRACPWTRGRCRRHRHRLRCGTVDQPVVGTDTGQSLSDENCATSAGNPLQRCCDGEAGPERRSNPSPAGCAGKTGMERARGGGIRVTCWSRWTTVLGPHRRLSLAPARSFLDLRVFRAGTPYHLLATRPVDWRSGGRAPLSVNIGHVITRQASDDAMRGFHRPPAGDEELAAYDDRQTGWCVRFVASALDPHAPLIYPPSGLDAIKRALPARVSRSRSTLPPPPTAKAQRIHGPAGQTTWIERPCRVSPSQSLWPTKAHGVTRQSQQTKRLDHLGSAQPCWRGLAGRGSSRLLQKHGNLIKGSPAYLAAGGP
jgi:hypothetical protein